MRNFRQILFYNLLIMGIIISSALIIGFGVREYNFIKNQIRENAIIFSENSLTELIEAYQTQGVSGNTVLLDSKINQITEKNRDVRALTLFNSQGKYLIGNRDIQFSSLQSQKPYFLYNDKLINSIEEVKSPFFVVVPQDVGRYIAIYKFDDSRLLILTFYLGITLIGIVIFIILLSYFISKKMSISLSSPLEKLTKYMKIYGKTGTPQKIKNLNPNSEEIKLLTSTFSGMQDDLEVAHKEHIEKEKLDKEIELAGEIQQKFLPKEGYRDENVLIEGILIPAAQVGGDMYDIIEINKDQILFYLADVTGHGVSAGVVSSMISSGVEILSKENEEIDESNLKSLAISLHEVLFKKTDSDVFATVTFVVFNKKDHKLIYLSCGHERLLHISDKPHLLEKGGLALGLVEEISNTLKPKSIILKEKESIYLYSDGVPEAMNEKKQQFGIERFAQAIRKSNNLENIVSEIQKFTGKDEFVDDVTIIKLQLA